MGSVIGFRSFCCAIALLFLQAVPPSFSPALAAEPVLQEAAYSFEEVMIPMRDGVHLQTVIIRPLDATESLPILFKRTPYGIPDKAFAEVPVDQVELAKDGYIFVYQNLRGRFKSEGVFEISTHVDLDDPKAIDETTDAYDSIEWLVKNVPGNNGKVGMRGVSYSGLTAGMALLKPHPALAAVSDQAAPADFFMNDDLHHYGALRLSYAFEYAVLEQSEKHANASFVFDKADTYEWYLKLGPLSNVRRHLGDRFQVWNDLVDHPDYDEYWQEQAWYKQIKSAKIPTLTVAGFWDQEDPWGPWQVYRAAERDDPDNINVMVAGPWTHGGWARTPGDMIGKIPLGGQETGVQFRQDIEAPFFRYWLHNIGEKPAWDARIFETGSNVWREYPHWPPADAKSTRLYFHADGSLSFTPPGQMNEQGAYREYISDPANPVPYRPRPIVPTFSGTSSAEDWAIWETMDQRFVDNRPDVLTYVSAPLEHDVRISGPITANLVASSSGTDSDFVVKLIDVYAEAEDTPEALRGYQLPIAMDVRRGRYLEDYSHPQPLKPDVPTRWEVPLRDHAHVFLKGHRIMVQVQSSWFPIIDRNPQSFVPSIYTAEEKDFIKARQRVYSTAESDLASYIDLPIVP